MKRRYLWWLVVTFTVVHAPFSLVADMITVHNESDQRCYCAVYYARGDQAWRVSSIVPVAAEGLVKMSRPPYRWWHDRELLCRSAVADLPESTTGAFLKKWASQSIGASRGSIFHMLLVGEDLWRGFNDFHWKTHHVTDEGSRRMKESAVVVAGEVADVQEKFASAVRAAKEVKPVVAAAGFARGLSGAIRLPSAALRAAVGHEAKKALGKLHPAIKNRRPAYAKKKARVRQGNELCSGERRALDLRMVWAKRAAEQRLGAKGNLRVDHLPRIAVVASGGGYRAMIMTLGWLNGAAREGILDMATWLVGLSGSTWAMAPWLSEGTNTISDVRSQLFSRIADRSIVPTAAEGKQIAEACAVPFLQDQPFSLVQPYGALLANRLLAQFDKDRHRVYLSDQAARVATGQVPIPIYTAAAVKDGKAQEWFEFTPWEIGAPWLSPQGAYVPTWAYGRRFLNGSSVDYNLEKDLGFHMGTFGSAFACSVGEAYQNIGGFGPKQFDRLLRTTIVRELETCRVEPAEVSNFTFGLRGGVLNEQKNLALVDGAACFNLPYPPVSGQRVERTSDIIIFLDASSGAIGEVFCDVANYAQQQGLPFPRKTVMGNSLASECKILADSKLSREQKYRHVRSVGKDAVTVLKDEQGPTVIYVPRVNDPALWPLLDDSEDCSNPDKFAEYKTRVRDCQDYEGGKNCDAVLGGFDIEGCANGGDCSTPMFKYRRGLLEQLTGLAEFQMRAISGTILDEIKQFIEHKSDGGVTFEGATAAG